MRQKGGEKPSSEHEEVYHASVPLSSRFAFLDSAPLA